MKKTLIVIALLAGLVTASHAAITAVGVPGTNTFDEGVYEIFLGPSIVAQFGQTIENTFRGQTITTSNAFDLGSISILYDTADLTVSNMVLHVYPVADPLTNGFIFPPTSTLFSASFDAPPAANDIDNTLILDLGTNISLAADSYYMILLASTNASETTFRWYRSAGDYGDFYPGGSYIKNDGNMDTAGRDLLIGLGLEPSLTANDDRYVLDALVTSTSVAAPGVLLNDLRYDSAVLVDDITPNSGTLTFNTDGSFTCSGLADGTNSFTYSAVGGSVTSAPATVSVVVTISEDPPIVLDDVYSMDVAYGNHIEGNFGNNDTNVSLLYDLEFTIEDASTVVNGVLTTNGLLLDGEFYYIANPGFTGTETFTYRASTPLASSVGTVTLNVLETDPGGVVIDAFDTYDNRADQDVKDMPDADPFWDANGSGFIEIQDYNEYGPNQQWIEFGWSGGRYRGMTSRGGLWAGIPSSSVEYWLYFEMYIESLEGNGIFGVSTNAVNNTGSSYRGDFVAGVRMTANGSTNTLDLYAVTGGGEENDVLLAANAVNEDQWYGVWMNINNVANTFDVYFGDPNNQTTPGTRVGAGIAFDDGGSDLTTLLGSAISDTRVDTIINLDPDNFEINLPANLYGNSRVSDSTLQLVIGLNAQATDTDYWPVSSDGLSPADWQRVEHSDTPGGTFAVTNLSVASGTQSNKVIYVKSTDDAQFFRIENQ